METTFSTLSPTYTGMNGYALWNQYFVLKIKNVGENSQEQYAPGVYYSVCGSSSESHSKFKHHH